MKKTLWLSGTLVLIVFAGCSQQSRDDVKKAGDSVKNDMVNVMHKAGAKTGEAMEEARKAAVEAVESIRETARKAGERAKEETAQAVGKLEKKAAELKEEIIKSGKTATETAKSTEKGKSLYAKCAGCHGADGKTKALGKSAIIAGQNSGELQEKLRAYREGKRNANGMGTLMQGQVSSLKEKEIAQLADYIARLK
jgi:cytochrome c553